MAPRIIHASSAYYRMGVWREWGSTLTLQEFSGRELTHTCWVRPGIYLLPAWPSSSSQPCGMYFPTLQTSNLSPHTVSVSRNTGVGLWEAQAGPPYLGSCCPSHTGPRSPANPAGERKQEVSQASTHIPAQAQSRANSPSPPVTSNTNSSSSSEHWLDHPLDFKSVAPPSNPWRSSWHKLRGRRESSGSVPRRRLRRILRQIESSDPISALAHTCLHSLGRVPAENIFCGSFSAFEEVHDP